MPRIDPGNAPRQHRTNRSNNRRNAARGKHAKKGCAMAIPHAVVALVFLALTRKRVPK